MGKHGGVHPSRVHRRWPTESLGRDHVLKPSCTHPVVVDNLSDNGSFASMGSRSEEDNWKMGHHGKSGLLIPLERSVSRHTSPNLDKSLES